MGIVPRGLLEVGNREVLVWGEPIESSSGSGLERWYLDLNGKKAWRLETIEETPLFVFMSRTGEVFAFNREGELSSYQKKDNSLVKKTSKSIGQGGVISACYSYLPSNPGSQEPSSLLIVVNY